MASSTLPQIQKPPLNREELRDVIDLSLWAGQILLQHGAETQRVESTVHRLGTNLGCEWMDILVSPNAIVATTISGEEFRTKLRRVVGLQVDMTKVSAINRLSRRIENGELDRFGVRSELQRISQIRSHYKRWQVVLTVGLACASFSRLFGGDIGVFTMTFIASSIAMFVRQELARRHFNMFLVVISTAFVAGLIASVPSVLEWGDDPQIALASSVLLLVPGVPLINFADDIIKGHMVTGITRGIMGGLVSMGIALGLALAMEIMGVNGL